MMSLNLFIIQKIEKTLENIIHLIFDSKKIEKKCQKKWKNTQLITKIRYNHTEIFLKNLKINNKIYFLFISFFKKCQKKR